MNHRCAIGRISVIACILSLFAPVFAQVKPKIVTFKTSDRVEIAADYYAPKKSVEPAPMVVLLHMYNSDRSAWAPLIQPLHDSGFAILALDLRGHGANADEKLEKMAEQRDKKLFRAMEKDVYAAYEFLAKQNDVDRARFAIVGASVGCSVALRYAGNDPSVDAVVCMTPGIRYLGLTSAIDVKRMFGRKMLFLASEDERKAADELKDIGDKAGKKAKDGAKPNDIDVRIVGDGRVHGTRMFGKISGIEKQIVEYLREAVEDWSEEPVLSAWKGKKFHKAESDWAKSADPGKLRHLSDASEATRRGLKSAEKKLAPALGS